MKHCLRKVGSVPNAAVCKVQCEAPQEASRAIVGVVGPKKQKQGR